MWKGGAKIVGVNWVAKYFRFEKGVNKFEVWKGGAKIVGVNWVGVKNLRCEKGVKIFSIWN